jgi:capsular exopolysaccharide synthesis family protein
MAPAASSGGAPPQGGLTGSDIRRVLRGNLPVLAAMIVLSGGVGYVVNSYLAKYYSKYTAKGYCEVKIPLTTDAVLRGGRSGLATQDINIEQRTQVQILRNEALFSQVLQNDSSPIRTTDWFKSFATPSLARQNLMKNFGVNAIPETRLISVEMQYSKPEDAKTIVEEIVKQQISNQDSAVIEQASTRLGELNNLKSRYELELRNVQRDMKDVADDISKAGMSPTGGNFSPTMQQLDSTSKALTEQKDNQGRAKAELEMITAQLDKGETPPRLQRMVEGDPEVLKLTDQLHNLELQIQTDTRGDDNRDHKYLLSTRDAVKAAVENTKKSKLAALRLSYPDDLKSAISTADANIKSLTEQMAKLSAVVNAGNALVQKYQALADKEHAYTVQLQDVSNGLEAVRQGSAQGPTLDWAIGGKPISPEIPSFPNLPVTLSVAVLIGVALSLTYAFARELMDSSIRSPRDVAKVGPIAVLGTISHEDDDPQAAGSRLPLLIADAPHSMTAEQLRQLRTRLQHAGSLDSLRSMLITSPNPGDGKTTIAANLAAGLALVGRKILFVDANFRRPELHKLFGVDNSQGFASALAAPDQLASYVKATKIPNLYVLPAGPKLANATEILEGANLHEFIEKALETYDHVIFDSGPLLFASETVAMAPRVDGVVTVLRASQSTRGVLERVKETLRQLKAESLGVVLNGVRSHGGGYYGRNIKTYYEYAGNGTPQA